MPRLGRPLHLLALLAALAIAGYAVAHLVHQSAFPRILIWFGAALVGHDLIAFPLYALADRSVSAALRALWPRWGAPTRVPALNYIRVPALGSVLLLVVYLPGIIRQGAATYHAATGGNQQPFRDRWLLLTAVMFILSALAYAIRLRRAPHREPDPDPGAEPRGAGPAPQ